MKKQIHPAIWALSVTAFAIGVAEFIVVGILQSILLDLNIPIEKAGGLVGLYALALATGTPVIVLMLARYARKFILIILVVFFLIGNLISACSAGYGELLVGRIVTAISHGGFFAIGATVAASLAPAKHTGRAISLMFAGLTLAMVIGVPLGSYIGNSFGWRFPFYAVTVLAAVSLISVILLVPKQPVTSTGSARVQLRSLKQPGILAMMCITTLGFGASFPVFTFIAPILTGITSFNQGSVSVILVIFGVATMLGNLAGGALSSMIGWEKSLRWKLFGLSVTFIVFSIFIDNKIGMILLIFLWGVFAFGVSPSVQMGMLFTAKRWAPFAIDFSSALNISAFNLGIALGETVGGIFVSHNLLMYTPLAGVALAVLAQFPLLWLTRNNIKIDLAMNSAEN